MNERLEKVKKLYEGIGKVKEVEGVADDVYTLVYDRLFPGLKKQKVTLAKDIDKQYDMYDYVEDAALVGDNDIAVVVDNRSDTDLVREVAKELKLSSEVRPYTTNTGKKALIAIIRIPEHISSMPADKYLRAIGKDIKDVRVKKGKEVEEGCKSKKLKEGSEGKYRVEHAAWGGTGWSYNETIDNIDEILSSNELADAYGSYCDAGDQIRLIDNDTDKLVSQWEKTTQISENNSLTEDAKIYIDIGDFNPWSGAVDTWDKIVDNGLIDELDSLLEDTYPEGLSETELNDILWFDGDWVLDMLGIGEEDEDEEDEEDVEEGLLGKIPDTNINVPGADLIKKVTDKLV